MTPVSVDDLEGMLLGGRYRVQKLIGRGGMGAVHLARDEQLGSDVAVKVVREALLDDPNAMLRFKREARLLPELVHEHIVRAFGAGEDQGLLWIAMELLEGRTLRQRIEERGRMPWKDSLAVVRQIASALAAAHDKGVVHRDLKPDNVMLVGSHDGDPDIRLLDFGVARAAVREGSAASMTGTGMMIGTPGYIAPEVIIEGTADDARSDLYALGVVWFEMLTGARPFSAKTPVALAMAHAHQPAPTPSSLLPFHPIPAPVEALVMQLMAKRPDERPASASALIETLAHLEEAVAADEKAPRRSVSASMPTVTDVRPTPSFPQHTSVGGTPAPTVQSGPPAMTPPPIGVGAMTPSTAMNVPQMSPGPAPLQLSRRTIAIAATGSLGMMIFIAVVTVFFMGRQASDQPVFTPPVTAVAAPPPVLVQSTPSPLVAPVAPVIPVVPVTPVRHKPKVTPNQLTQVQQPQQLQVTKLTFSVWPKKTGIKAASVDGVSVELPFTNPALLSGAHEFQVTLSNDQTFTKRFTLMDSTSLVKLSLTLDATTQEYQGVWSR